MATQAYLKNTSSIGALPSWNFKSYSGELSVPHDFPTQSEILEMGASVGSDSTMLGGGYDQYPEDHYSHIRTWATKPLGSAQTFSSYVVLSAYMGYSKQQIYTTKVWDDYELGLFHFEYSTSTHMVAPVVFVGVWDATNGIIATLSHTTGSALDYDTVQLQGVTCTVPIGVTVSEGDRIIAELHFKSYAAPGTNYLAGTQYEYIYYGGSPYQLPSLYFPFNNLTYKNLIENDVTAKYNIRDITSHPARIKYNILAPTVSRSYTLPYGIYSYRYITLYMETESTARGGASLRMTPRSTESLAGYDEDYSQKWVFPEPSLHKYFMIEDFEGYEDLADAALYWTVSDGLVTFSALKTFSAENLNDYEILTFYAKSTSPAYITARFGDKNGASSSNMNFLITDKWQRFETEIPWGECDSGIITSFNVYSAHSSSILIDDIAVLDYEDSSENVDWIKMHLTNIEFEREQKISSFKIPFKQMEHLQCSGEKNGEGQFKIRTLEHMQSEFLDETLRNNTPLYFRYKNMGLPVILKNTGRKFKQIIPTQVSSEITIPFYEIYDSSQL